MNNEEVRLECSPKLVKDHSEVNHRYSKFRNLEYLYCAHPPLGRSPYLVIPTSTLSVYTFCTEQSITNSLIKLYK